MVLTLHISVELIPSCSVFLFQQLIKLPAYGVCISSASTEQDVGTSR